ncbi:MAG: right-handed parallel beta-helix repeat-containing protein [Opitutaceae bacterium]|jgi:parallel beta-helix repeat protein|nr:right-handed parallel beta-helix repeat-containing protein [Opitutaceae bacterium]
MTCSEKMLTRPGHLHLLLALALPMTLSAAAATAAAATARTLHVDQNHPQATDTDTAAGTGAGDAARPFRTIAAATAQAGPGDTVYVAPGVYREHIAPVRGGTKDAPVTWQAAPGHRVFVRGSDVWTPAWTPLAEHPGVFTAPLDEALFANAIRNPCRSGISIASQTFVLPARPVSAFQERTTDWIKDKQPGRLPRTLGQLFVDGQPLREAETIAEVLRTPGAWIVNEQGDGLIVHFFPTAVPLAARLVELTTRDRVFAPARRGLSHIIVRGFVFEHAANQGPFPQLGAVSLRSGRHWLVEDNIIRHAKTIGIDAGSEYWKGDAFAATDPKDQRFLTGAHNTIRNNTITDNGLCGLAAWHCAGLVVEGNRVERNNALGFRPSRIDHFNAWEEHAGIKLHGATGARIEGNFVRDNDAHGIWIDNGFTRARVTRNVILNNAGAGIILELGNGPALIDGNTIAFTRPYSDYYAGDGIYGHDASGITIAHNLSFANARHGVFFQRITNRNYAGAPVEASRLRVLNNLLFDNARSAINLPFDGERARDNHSDHNIVSLRHARFIANQGEASPLEGEVATRIRSLLAGEASAIASRKDYAGWSLHDGLTIAEWRRLTGRDAATVVENPRRIIIRPHTQEIEILLDAVARRPVPAVAMPDAKIPGTPLPAGDNVLAGPWQHLGDLNQRFFLWPRSNLD